MAAEAEALLKTSGWLAEPLRGPKPSATPPEPSTDDTQLAAEGPQSEGQDEPTDAPEYAQAAE